MRITQNDFGELGCDFPSQVFSFVIFDIALHERERFCVTAGSLPQLFMLFTLGTDGASPETGLALEDPPEKPEFFMPGFFPSLPDLGR